MKIKNIDFNNIPNKIGTAIGNKIVQVIPENISREEFINSQNFYKLISSVDIDWNGAVINENTEINDTSDLIDIIKELVSDNKELKEELYNIQSQLLNSELENENVIDTNYSGQTDESGYVNIINNNE